MKDVVKVANKPGKGGRPRRRKRNMSLYYLTLFLIGALLFFILSRTVLFNIEEYIVRGNSKYSDLEILNAGNLKVGKNMYNLNLKRAEERIIDRLIYVEDVKLKRKLPNQLIVEVTEARAFACCEYEGSRYAVITPNGRYLETEQLSPRTDLILVKGMELKNVSLGAEFESNDETKRTILLELFDSIRKLCDGKITYIDITDRTNIMLGYDNRIDIDFGSSLDYEYKLKYIITVIEDNLDENAEGKLIYHSAAAGASFIKREDLELTELERQAAINAQNSPTEVDNEGNTEQQE